MKKVHFYIIIGVFVLALVAVFGVFFGMQKFRHREDVLRDQNGNAILADGVVECDNMRCFEERLKTCAPALIEMGGSMSLSMQIYGLEGEKCHYEMHIDQKAGKSCFFEKDNLGGKLLRQLFGENEGMEKIVKESCISV